MPLFLPDGSILDSFNYSIFREDNVLNKNSADFFKSKIDSQNSVRCLYVGQREYATVRFNDPSIDIIGSDAATTCHILLLVDENNNNCSLCHFDGSDTSGGFTNMINSLKKLKTNPNDTDKYSIYVVGGFDDDRESSIELTLKLFRIFTRSSEILNLKLCIVTEMNDELKNNLHYPIIYGLGYNIKQKSVFMCNKFIDKGPDMGVRSARHFSKNGNMNIYDTEKQLLTIGPFHYDPIKYVRQCLRLSDRELLQYFSTSPEQEPDDFLPTLKEGFKMMVDHPQPLVTYFNNQTKIYTKIPDGSWQLVK